MQRKLTPRNKLIVAIVLVVLIIAALVALLVVPQIKKLGDLDAQISTAEQDAQSARVVLERLFDVRNRAAQTDASLMQSVTSFPENPELPSAIIELQNLAYEHDVQVRAVAPKDLDQRGTYSAVPIELNIVGEWPDVVGYVKQLQGLERQYRVVEVSSDLIRPSDYDDRIEKLDFGVYYPETVIFLEAYVIPASDDSGTFVPPAPAPAQ